MPATNDPYREGFPSFFGNDENASPYAAEPAASVRPAAKCRICGSEIAEGAKRCLHCGAAQTRAPAVSEVGRAMRALYDRFGADGIFSNSACLVNGLADLINGLGDLTLDSKKTRNQIKMAMDAGIGRLYLEQLRVGAPDPAFDRRVRTVLTEDAGLNDWTAEEIAGFFDEMIGWRQAPRTGSAYRAAPQRTPDPMTAYAGSGSVGIERKPVANPDRPDHTAEQTVPYDDAEQTKPSGSRGWIKLFILIVVLCIISTMILAELVNSKKQTAEDVSFPTGTKATIEATTSVSESIEESKRNEKEREQEELKTEFASMNGYRGALTANDFMILENGEYSKLGSSQYVFNMNAKPGVVTARGLQIGDSKERAAALYGKPDGTLSASDNWVIYRLIKNFEENVELAEKIYGNTVYRYYYHDVNQTFSSRSRESDLVILDLVFDKSTGAFCGYAWVNE